jgi:hypothetical protein
MSAGLFLLTPWEDQGEIDSDEELIMGGEVDDE